MSYRDELVQVAAVAAAAIQCCDTGSSSLDGAGLTSQLNIMSDIMEERKRQESKWGEQTHNSERWHTILSEEVGEVARAILDNDYD